MNNKETKPSDPIVKESEKEEVLKQELMDMIGKEIYKAKAETLRWQNLCRSMLAEMDAYDCGTDIKEQARKMLGEKGIKH